MAEFKSGFVSICGRTNVGKSTLINLLVGEKIAAIANKVQTTRTQIRGIVNRENSQIIFIDTPGIHKPKTKLNENMIELSWDAISNSDVILFLIEADSKEIGRGDMKILEKIREANKKCILIINKVDLINKEELAKLIDLYKNEYDFSAIIPISATKNKYKEVVLDEIEKNLKSTICKNLFLVNSNKSQYYLLMLKGHNKFKTKERDVAQLVGAWIEIKNILKKYS